MQMLSLIAVTLKTANAFVAAHHRHHKPVTGHKFSIGCEINGRLVGVAIVGRPVSRYLDDDLTLEVTRLCTTGERNACSKWACAVLIALTALLALAVITLFIRESNRRKDLKNNEKMAASRITYALPERGTQHPGGGTGV